MGRRKGGTEEVERKKIIQVRAHQSLSEVHMQIMKVLETSYNYHKSGNFCCKNIFVSYENNLMKTRALLMLMW